ncbi:MAG: antibiotic biosynthesis monooxygenase [Oscillatoriales cyanobacterium RM1_1_9]|nr:antibiotic biosynthesis monooxygenase [Oscillatoriales cyanobacterium SM2_3_0]NJO47560.1 antibiotic biosynthesis monooxygenase [Oscillatoriales cyanobacterium RM2_1_1]NJO72098.1 antibiotic biosynthesis monooxygenase [Oscillatoriales cyanobacterium RM1_1_9]
MSEFLDFLKHQYAYVAVGEFKPGRFDEAEHLFEKAVSTYTKGFKGSYLLQEPGTDRGIAIIFWENIDDMDANHTAAYDAIMQEMAPLFVKPPHTAFYEVCSEVHPDQLQEQAEKSI